MSPLIQSSVSLPFPRMPLPNRYRDDEYPLDILTACAFECAKRDAYKDLIALVKPDMPYRHQGFKEGLISHSNTTADGHDKLDWLVSR